TAVSRADEEDEHEDDGADDQRALRSALPRRRRGDPDRATALLCRSRLGMWFRAVALLGFRFRVLGRLLELVPFGVDPDGLVLVAALLLHPAPLLPRRHGGLA